VTGILPLFLVAIPAGIVGIVQSNRRGQRGRGLAVAGLVLGVLWVLGIAGIAFAMRNAHLDPELGRVGDVLRPAVGVCYHQDPVDDAWTAVSCDGAHDAEVYAVSTLPAGPWPGSVAVFDEADSRCEGAWAGYVGSDYFDSSYDYAWFTPDAAEWSGGERRVVCVVVPLFGTLPEHSVRNSGR
jgi:hypothetical protein